MEKWIGLLNIARGGQNGRTPAHVSRSFDDILVDCPQHKLHGTPGLNTQQGRLPQAAGP